MIGKFTITRTGYDPEHPTDDPTLEPSQATETRGIEIKSDDDLVADLWRHAFVDGGEAIRNDRREIDPQTRAAWDALNERFAELRSTIADQQGAANGE